MASSDEVGGIDGIEDELLLQRSEALRDDAGGGADMYVAQRCGR